MKATSCNEAAPPTGGTIIQFRASGRLLAMIDEEIEAIGTSRGKFAKQALVDKLLKQRRPKERT